MFLYIFGVEELVERVGANNNLVLKKQTIIVEVACGSVACDRVQTGRRTE
jgi:hypothetical protein